MRDSLIRRNLKIEEQRKHQHNILESVNLIPNDYVNENKIHLTIIHKIRIIKYAVKILMIKR